MRYIWFLGTSGAGKKRAVTDLSSDPNHILRSHLQLTGNVSYCSASLESQNREALIEHLSNEKNRDVLLIKSQASDSSNRLLAWRDLRKKDLHEVVFLFASRQVLRQRWDARGWPWTGQDDARIRGEQESQLQWVKELAAADFRILYFDSSDGYVPSNLNEAMRAAV